jgi:hypothetical protein
VREVRHAVHHDLEGVVTCCSTSSAAMPGHGVMIST